VVRRARARAPLFAGDRGHLYDQMAQRGLSTGATSLVCAGVQAALVALGLLATRTEPAASGAIVIATALALLAGAAAGGFLSSTSPRSAR